MAIILYHCIVLVLQGRLQALSGVLLVAASAEFYSCIVIGQEYVVQKPKRSEDLPKIEELLICIPHRSSQLFSTKK